MNRVALPRTNAWHSNHPLRVQRVQPNALVSWQQLRVGQRPWRGGILKQTHVVPSDDTHREVVMSSCESAKLNDDPLVNRPRDWHAQAIAVPAAPDQDSIREDTQPISSDASPRR